MKKAITVKTENKRETGASVPKKKRGTRIISMILTILMIGGIALSMTGCDGYEAVPAGGQSGYGVLQGTVTYDEGWPEGWGRTHVLIVYKNRATANIPIISFGEIPEIWWESPDSSEYEVVGLPPGEYLVIFIAKTNKDGFLNKQSFYDRFSKYRDSGLFSEVELQDLADSFSINTYYGEESISIRSNRTATLDYHFSR